MSAKVFVIVLAACNQGPPSPYGARAHMLGRVEALTVLDQYADVVKKVPELKDTGVADLHDATGDYRIFYTENGRVETITAFLPGHAKDVVAAWRGAIAGTYASGQPATYWLESDTIYLIAEGRKPGEFFFAADRYVPVSKIWDDGHDVRAFGLDLLNRPLAEDVAAIDKLGFAVTVNGQLAQNASQLFSDSGKVEWALEGDPVHQIRIQIGPYEIPSNVRAIDELYVRKWGKPTEDHGRMVFHVEPHEVVEFHDKAVWITQ